MNMDKPGLGQDPIRFRKFGSARLNRDLFMTDLIFIAVMALVFVAGELYAHWCEKL